MARNAVALKCGRALENFMPMVQSLKAMVERFIESLCCMDRCSLSGFDFAGLPGPSAIGSTRVGGIDFNRPRTWLVARAVLTLATLPRGFTASQLSRHVCSQGGADLGYRPVKRPTT